MAKKKIVLLDGRERGDDDLSPSFSALREHLDREGGEVTCYPLREIKLAHCTGCFGCWVKTPGICVASDQGGDVLRSMIHSDVTLLFSPVTFGGYSSVLKIMVDRFIPLILPFFGKYHGEIHHTPRYASYPRLVGIGMQRGEGEREAEVFKALVGRNAINFHASSFAADVFPVEQGEATLREGLESLLSRSDLFPSPGDVLPFFPEVDRQSVGSGPEGAGNALLVVGSPKVKKGSTSSLWGAYLAERLEAGGWTTETLTLKASLNREKGQVELCSAVDRSDLMILSFPLYIDALPYLVTRALEVIARHRTTAPAGRPQRIFTLVNNGFPEAHQNALALAICRSFADRCGMSWAGALAVGAGEVLGGGKDLADPKRSGLPVQHIVEALDRAGADLSMGRALSLDVQGLIAKVPIPLLPFGVWRWLFPRFGALFWQRMARENGVRKEEMYATPYRD
jgi:multimeric flavodoxin WrbA